MLVLGGGLVGGALAGQLALRGHGVLLATRSGRARDGLGAIALDLTALPGETALLEALRGVDVVVNTVGIFLESGQQGFDAVHVNGPRVLLEAARAAGVRRWIQLSALGADAGSALPYFASKGKMDALLLSTQGVETAVVRPSLVFAPEGTSTRWFAQLASLPVTPLPGAGNQLVQPLHLDDLLGALVALVERDQVPVMLDAVGPRPLPLRDYLQVFKRAMRTGGTFLHMPMAPLRRLAALAPRLGPAPFDADAMSMLEAGNTADPAPFHHWLGRTPRDPDSFVPPAQGSAMANRAILGWTIPAMRVALAAMWLATAVVSLWVYPRADSLAMLAQVGLHGAVAVAALWAGALADLALGIGMLVRRFRTLAYAGQLLLVAAYTLIISIWLPEQWAHPFGPVLKNLPLLAMILALLMLDRTHGPDPR
ncbi:SDR family oxidoreductase [Luteimonas sp. MC1782]|nr:SDR family oxidoreductase [Luteimonas sp. MC1895]